MEANPLLRPPNLVYRGVADYVYLKDLDTTGVGIRYVYVVKDRSGDPLYVGCSSNPAGRLCKHRQKAWWVDAYSVDVWQLDIDLSDTSPTWKSQWADRQARAWESRAIIKLRPLHNKQGRPERAQIA